MYANCHAWYFLTLRETGIIARLCLIVGNDSGTIAQLCPKMGNVSGIIAQLCPKMGNDEQFIR